jgi:hypothetical protein
MRCDPANTLIKKLGGLTVVARACGCTVSAVLRWRLPKDRGGTGGLVPSRHIAPLIKIGAEPADFVARSDEVSS